MAPEGVVHFDLGKNDKDAPVEIRINDEVPFDIFISSLVKRGSKSICFLHHSNPGVMSAFGIAVKRIDEIVSDGSLKSLDGFCKNEKVANIPYGLVFENATYVGQTRTPLEEIEQYSSKIVKFNADVVVISKYSTAELRKWVKKAGLIGAELHFLGRLS